MRDQIDQAIQSAEKIVITSHKGPDHDAIGSALAMGSYIKTYHPKAKYQIVFEGEINNGFNYLPGFDGIHWEQDISNTINSADLVIYLDGNSRSRFTRSFEKIKNEKLTTICIDHHMSDGEDFDIELIDTNAASTCQILADELFQENVKLTQEAIEQLAEGIMGDTGSLSYIKENNSNVLVTMKRLVDLGNLDLENINRRFRMFKLPSFRVFQEYVANTHNVELANAPNLTYSYVGKDFVEGLEDKSLTKEGSYLFMILRSIKDHPWGFIVKYDPENPSKFNLSFRSTTGAPNVRLICEKYFDGGGHDLAAGATYILQKGEESWDAEQVAEKIISILNSAPIPMTSSS